MMDFGFGFMGFGFIFWLLMLGILFLLIRWLVSGSTAQPNNPPQQPSSKAQDPALQALRLRFAQGEIDEEEYKRRRRLLEEDLQRADNRRP